MILKKLSIRQKKLLLWRRKKNWGGDIYFYFFSENPEKDMILAKISARATSEHTRTTSELVQTTCRHHITREFGLKTRKKIGGGGKIVKKIGGDGNSTIYFSAQSSI